MPLIISRTTSDEKFREKIAELSGKEFMKCFQCGTCSGSCPMCDHIDATPRKVMALLQLGDSSALDVMNTYWVCASCHTCMARCPRGVDITKVMEALRLIKLRENTDHVNLSNLQPEEIVDLPQIALVSGFRKMTS
jgi:heterodisulfide reductase subunit C